MASFKTFFNVISFLILFSFLGCEQEKKQIIGVKIYEQKAPFNKLVSSWKNLGINTAFTSVSLFSNNEFRTVLKENEITSFVIVPIFYNPELLEKSPEYYAITAKGKEAKDDWVEFVCPSHKEYRKQKITEIENIIRNYNPDGISIDFIRHFVFWEMVYPENSFSSLPNSCFDNRCLDDFQNKNKIQIPENIIETLGKADWILKNHNKKWTDWKCNLITSMIEEINFAAKQINPNIIINVHIVPWTENDFNGAITKIAGQDIAAISPFTNYLSPMTYAHMVKQKPSWIHRVVRKMDVKAKNKIIPSIQVNKAYLEEPLNKQEFEESLKQSLLPPSQGVIFWSWERLVQDSLKIKIVKRVVNK